VRLEDVRVETELVGAVDGRDFGVSSRPITEVELLTLAADLLTGRGLLILKDENGNWPGRYVTAIAYDNYMLAGRRAKPSEIARALLDDLAEESRLALPVGVLLDGLKEER